MSLNDLPTWILWKIAQDSSDVYRGLVTASRKLGLWSLKNQGIIQNLFTVKTDVHDIPNTYTKYELRGKLHRIDGPALESSDGTYPNGYYREWWVNGKLHRDDGPAIEYSSGDKEWYYHGKKHRENGPAFESSDGTYPNGYYRQWYRHGELHRDDGPAIEYYNGYKYWYCHGKLNMWKGR